MLETTNKSNHASAKIPVAESNTKRQTACVATIKQKCNYCKGEHSIYYCKDFLALPISQRIAEIRSRKICLNCLRSTTHTYNKCTSGGCKTCQAKHNTLLHAAPNPTQSSTNSDAVEKDNGNSKITSTSTVLATHAAGYKDNIILSTAVVHVHDQFGNLRSCRVLLDCGFQANFISRQFLSELGLSSR